MLTLVWLKAKNADLDAEVASVSEDERVMLNVLREAEPLFVRDPRLAHAWRPHDECHMEDEPGVALARTP
jgi:hypothetical protein